MHSTDCVWAQWSEWTREYDTKVGQSTRHRRIRHEAKFGGRPCEGYWNETRPFESPQTSDCIFSQWSEWTPCTATCGGGTRSQHRRVAQHASPGGSPCTGPLRTTEPCSKLACGQGKPPVLGSWKEWRGCDDQFPLQRFRNRVVLQPAEGDFRLDATALAETDACENVKKPSCILSQWSLWTPCSGSCGGQQSRSRDIDYSGSDTDCKLQWLGYDRSVFMKETQACGKQHCVMTSQSELSQWSEWSLCSRKCGLGTTSRSRKILREGSGGLGMGMALQEVKGCVTSHCGEVDCRWAEWDQWSACSCTCGGGTKRRSRVIAQAPRHGGVLCEALDKSEVGACNTQACGQCVDGLWGAWGQWSKCSATCGGAFRVRHRDVMQRPNTCGKPAIGLEDEYHMCNDVISCTPSEDCELAEWAEWSACSCDCFGVKERHRRILRFAKGDGKSCGSVASEEAARWMPREDEMMGYTARRLVNVDGFASLEEISACNPVSGEIAPPHCGPLPKRPCDFSPWGEWGECSATCDGGMQERARHIRTPNSHDGSPCDGPLAQVQGCGFVDCVQRVCKDCEWGPWSDWGDCSKCGGQRYRQRAVLKMPNECGKLCDPRVAKEVGKCTSHCEEDGFCSWGSWSSLAACSATCGTATMMRQRSLVFLKEEPPAKSELVGVGKCWNEQKLRYKAYRIKTMSTEAQCTDILSRSKERHNIRGVQYGEAMHICDILVDEHAELDMQAFAMPMELLKNPYHDQHATGPVESSNRAMGWRCWSRNSGTFFMAQKTLPCSGQQVDVLECPFKSCETCEPEDCVFGKWSEWGAASCTQLCERHRVISTMNKCGGLACDGPLVMTKHCHKDCERPECCSFAAWTEWDEASCTGDGGQKRRERVIAQVAVNGGQPCTGPTEETTACYGPSKDVDCEMGMWEEWSGCSATCGRGLHRRERRILQHKRGVGVPCHGALAELEDCEAVTPCGSYGDRNCELEQWSSWGPANEQGLCFRKRRIATQASGSGLACTGELEDVKLCQGVTDCQITTWSSWSSCDRPCDGGQQMRGRHITRNPRNGGQACPPELEEIRGCNEEPCDAKSCEVSEWREWTSCSTTCGRGTQKRTRYITQMPSEGGSGCRNTLAEQRECVTDESGGVRGRGECPGPTDCRWSDWSSWSGCTCECDGGQRTRDRTIAVMPSPGGTACKAMDKEEIEPCNTQPCSTGDCIDALWSEWTSWEDCTKSCDGGITWRSRKLRRQANECGKPPIGMSMEHASCNAHVSCGPNVDCVFGQWQPWSGCTTPCSGIKRRARVIAVHGKENGRWCEGPLKQTSPCNDDPSCGGGVPVDCQVSLWQQWGVCSVTCGIGQRIRQRNLQNNPHNAGKHCDRSLVVTKACSLQPCPTCTRVDCLWSEWEMWGACDKCGGQRKRYRHVKVHADCGGSVCEQKFAEEIAACPRACHTPSFCSWEDWQSWGECSTSCGDHGVRTRVRYLKSHSHPTDGYQVNQVDLNSMQGLDALEQKFHELRHRAKNVEQHRLAELGAAFGLGSLSFMAVMAMGQRLSRGQEDERPLSLYAPNNHRYEPAPSDEPL